MDKNKPFQPYLLEKKSLGHSGKSMALSKIGFSKNTEKKKKGYFPLDCLHHQSLTMKLTATRILERLGIQTSTSFVKSLIRRIHGLRTPEEEIAFTARPKIQSQSQIFRCGGSIFCLPHRPNFSDIFDFCLDWVSVVCDHDHSKSRTSSISLSLPN